MERYPKSNIEILIRASSIQMTLWDSHIPNSNIHTAKPKQKCPDGNSKSAIRVINTQRVTNNSDV